MARISCINRFPIKALSAESLDHVTLASGAGLPLDRRFALARSISDRTGASGNWPWQPPDQFLTLKRYAALAALSARYDAETGCVTIIIARPTPEAPAPLEPIGSRVDGDARSEAGRVSIGRFVSTFLAAQTTMSDASELAIKLVDAGENGHLTDRQTPFVSIINRASVDTMSQGDGNGPLDAVRFRGNLVVDGWEPWAERSMIGQRLTVGTTRLRIVEPIGRCAATHVNPGTAERDRNILKSLKTRYGHTDCGVYAIVEAAGDISVGDTLATH